jgi:hypothetical protein
MKHILIATTALLLSTAAQAATPCTWGTDTPENAKRQADCEKAAHGKSAANGVNTTTLYHANLWNVDNYTYDNGAVEQCVMGTGWTERKNVKSGWHLKFNLDTGLWWAFYKEAWRMTPGNEVMTVISVDDQSWSGRARVQSDRNRVANSFNVEQGTNFLVALRKAKQLSIVFPRAANETPFIVKIDQKALAKFEECSSRLIAEGGPDEAPASEEPIEKPSSNTITPPKYRGA